ncbi:MAG: protein kinase [Gammaproteobacteria bacterium]|nr:protein kinase [Gammaproteobacteria bacterium]
MALGIIFSYNALFELIKGMSLMGRASKIIHKLELGELYSKYTIREEPIGHGSYGVVYSGLDKTTNEKVAIKIIKKFPDDTLDRKRLFREIKILHMLEGHANTICLKNITTSTDNDTFLGIALIFEHHESDLSRIIDSRQPLTVPHLQYFLYQILYSVHYIHSAGLVHRDLKPANILVNSNCDLSICDFGLGRATQAMVMAEAEQTTSSSPPPLYRRLTHYVVTRWYRPPELIVGNSNAGEAPADMWSVGCILAELLLRRPLFEGAEDNISLMKLIFATLGTPMLEDCEWIENEKGRNKVKQYPIKPSQMNRIFKNKDPEAIDLLKNLLQFNPSKRLTAEQALQHPFVASLADKEPLKFSRESMSETKQRALNEYYAFEVDSEKCGQSSDTNRRINALIQQEVERYVITLPPSSIPSPSTASSSSSTVVPSFGTTASSSIVPLSSDTVPPPSTVPGTVFHHKRPRSPTVDSQHMEEANMSSTGDAPACT